MAIDEILAGRVRAALTGAAGYTEVSMFGGLGFLLHGNMVVAAGSRGLLVRCGAIGMDAALARGAVPMIMNGRPMKDFVWATTALDARAVKAWVKLARTFVDTLPPKAPRASRTTKTRR